MSQELSQKVMYYFEELCKVSRPSKHEEAASQFIAEFAAGHNLPYLVDEANNVLVRKEASGSAAAEKTAPVILQAHLDMVCVPREYDWSKGVQPILVSETKMKFPLARSTRRKEMKGRDLETGTDTTLGADDGIGVAMILGILDDTTLCHPPIIAIFTTDEEAGMSGARILTKETIEKIAEGLDLNKAKLINIDEEEDGVFSVGSAGGVRVEFRLPLELEDRPENLHDYTVRISDLTGGHSGMEINKKRANAHRLMGRVLDYLQSKEIDFSLYSIGGGAFDNAIPVECEIEVGIPQPQQELFVAGIKEIEAIFTYEYNRGQEHPIEKNMKITIQEKEPDSDTRYTRELVNKIITVLLLVPNDVLAMDIEDGMLVETSSNLGIVKVEADAVWMTGAVRSSVASRKQYVVNQMRRLAGNVGAEFYEKDGYPGWPYQESALSQLFLDTYEELYGAAIDPDNPEKSRPIARAIHAGLECGYFAEKLGDIEIIACGPTIHDVHTIKEVLEVDTVPKTVALLAAVLKKL